MHTGETACINRPVTLPDLMLAGHLHDYIFLTVVNQQCGGPYSCGGRCPVCPFLDPTSQHYRPSRYVKKRTYSMILERILDTFCHELDKSSRTQYEVFDYVVKST